MNKETEPLKRTYTCYFKILKGLYIIPLKKHRS